MAEFSVNVSVRTLANKSSSLFIADAGCGVLAWRRKTGVCKITNISNKCLENPSEQTRIEKKTTDDISTVDRFAKVFVCTTKFLGKSCRRTLDNAIRF